MVAPYSYEPTVGSWLYESYGLVFPLLEEFILFDGWKDLGLFDVVDPKSVFSAVINVSRKAKNGKNCKTVTLD